MAFFRVFDQETTSDKLAIPKLDYLDMLESPLDGVTLRDQYGNKWHVKLAIIENHCYFDNGWSKFVKDNSIEDGDFLFFQYDDNKVIDVKITGNDACDKKGVGALKFIEIEDEHVDAAKSIDVEMDKVSEMKVEELGYDGPFVEHVDEENQESSDEEEQGGSDEESYEQENESFEEQVDDEEREGSDEESNEHEDKIFGEELVDDEEVRESSDKEVKEWNSKRQKIPVTRELSNLRNQVKNLTNKVAPATPKLGGAKRRRMSKDEYYGTEIFESGILPMPKNPYFVTRIRPKRREELYIPHEVLKKIGLTQLPKKATLRDSSGRTWTTYRTQWGDGRKFFVEGWASFCRVNFVGSNDLCVCEFIKGQNPKDLTIQIQVVPTNNKTNLVKGQQKKV